MSTTLQFRRGNSAAAAAVTGANGEIYINTQTKAVHVHDGSTAGGFAMQTSAGLAANVATLTANNATNLNGQSASFYATASDLSSKQDALVSATNIKTINGSSILGSGNISISGGGGVGDGGTVTDITIGDVYYANNIVSPIPVITTTTYGDVITNTPLVVNAPLTVLSGDTSNTTFATLAGSELSGGQSGGTNNFGTISAGLSNINYRGHVTFTIQKPTNATITFFKSLRKGDVLTGIGTNGFYTGSFEMTIDSLQYGPRLDVGGQYYDIGEHGFVQFTGALTDINDAPTGSDLGINANIFTVSRPYDESTVNGGLSPTYLDTNQVVSNEIVVNKKLNVIEGAYLGATYSRSSGIYHAYGQGFGNINVQVDARTKDFVYVDITGSNSYFLELGWQTYEPAGEAFERTVTVLLKANSGPMNLSLAGSGSNTNVTVYNSFGDYGTAQNVPTYWSSNSIPTAVASDRVLELKFKFVANAGSYVGLYCDWKEYY